MDWLSAFFTNICVVPLLRRFPPRDLDRLAFAIGQGVYFFVPRRRRVALENLRRFYPGKKTERELKELARRGSASLALGAMENLRCRGFDDDLPRVEFSEIGPDSKAALHRGKALHEQTGGCIFVTAHIGGYTLLPYFFAEARIPLTIPINPLRNRTLQNRWCPLNHERALNAAVGCRRCWRCNIRVRSSPAPVIEIFPTRAIVSNCASRFGRTEPPGRKQRLHGSPISSIRTWRNSSARLPSNTCGCTTAGSRTVRGRAAQNSSRQLPTKVPEVRRRSL